MAKKKTKSINTAPQEKNEVQTVKKDTMTSKVEIKNPQESEKVSKIVGTIFIALGMILVGFGVYSFVKYNSTPQLDASLISPSLEDIADATNANSIEVAGTATGYDTVNIYVNGEKVGSTKVDTNDKFSYELALAQEGEYKISVAGIKGFPKRHLSSQSLEETVIVDRTAPVLGDIKFPNEVGTKTFTVSGTAEKSAQIIVKRGTDYYSATCDDQGYFKIVSISLDKGPNLFNVVVKDTAGNETVMEGKIKVIYSAESSVNGDATTDTSLPVAAGDLGMRDDFLLGNSLALILGILALVAGGTTTTVLYLKSKRS